MGCVYKLTSPSQKSYIGVTKKTAEQRFDKHKEHALGKRDAGALYSALRKYGPDTFTLEVLAVCSDWDRLLALEKKLIAFYQTTSPNGYNMTEGGEGVRGPMSEQARLRVSEAQKKRFQRPEERDKLRQLGLRAKTSKAWIESQRRRRKPKRPPMSREQWHARLMESMADPEIKRRTSEAAKLKWTIPGFREKYSLIRKNIKYPPCQPERKLKISESRKREWQDPVMRTKRLAALVKARAAKHTP